MFSDRLRRTLIIIPTEMTRFTNVGNFSREDDGFTWKLYSPLHQRPVFSNTKNVELKGKILPENTNEIRIELSE